MAELEIFRPVYDAHPALSDGTDDPIAVDKDRPRRKNIRGRGNTRQ